MPVSAAVVGEVKANVPVELPLKGTELEAKATGDMETIARTARILGGRILKEKSNAGRPLNKANVTSLGSSRFSRHRTRRERNGAPVSHPQSQIPSITRFPHGGEHGRDANPTQGPGIDQC